MIEKFEDLFRVSASGGFTLDKNYYKAIYKTKVLKYRGNPLPESDQGNIISQTVMFDADSDEDAEKTAVEYFGLSNPSFNPLKREFMEVQHELLELIPMKPPEGKPGMYKHVNKMEEGLSWKPVNIITHKDHKIKYPIYPDGFLGGYRIRRVMPHFKCDKKRVRYLYHPWHGAGDDYTEWHQYGFGHPAWWAMYHNFDRLHPTEVDKFRETEYTNLNSEEQELYKKYVQLCFLDRCYFEDGPEETYLRHQGRYFVPKYAYCEGTPEFHEDEIYGGIRRRYETKREKEVKLKQELQRAMSQVDYIKDQLNHL